MYANYFYIDGSALTSQIRRIRKLDRRFLARRLDFSLFLRRIISDLTPLHAGSYKRCTLYFPMNSEEEIDKHLVMPDIASRHVMRDIHVKMCGQKLKNSKDFDEFVEGNVPGKWEGRFQKSEKGIDIEICCDALKLASRGRVDRLFLLTNDDDFIPLCRAIKEFGANISLLHLSNVSTRNRSLLAEVDTFDAFDLDTLDSMFVPCADAIDSTAKGVDDLQSTGSMKPEAEPSDLEFNPSSDPIDESLSNSTDET